MGFHPDSNVTIKRKKVHKSHPDGPCSLELEEIETTEYRRPKRQSQVPPRPPPPPPLPRRQPPHGRPPYGRPPMRNPPMGRPPMGRPPVGRPPVGRPGGCPARHTTHTTHTSRTTHTRRAVPMNGRVLNIPAIRGGARCPFARQAGPPIGRVITVGPIPIRNGPRPLGGCPMRRLGPNAIGGGRPYRPSVQVIRRPGSAGPPPQLIFDLLRQAASAEPRYSPRPLGLP